jgi:hypothetical protein
MLHCCFVFLLFVREVLSSLFGANPLDFIRLFFLMGPVFVLHLSSRMEWLISAHFCVGHKFWSSLLHIMFAIDFFLLTLTIRHVQNINSDIQIISCIPIFFSNKTNHNKKYK